MTRLTTLIATIICLLLSPVAAMAQPRAMAITIDDLPFATAVGCAPGETAAFNRDFLAMLKAQRVPATGFAITARDCGEGPPDPALFEAWLEAGFGIGSHSATHPNINETDPAAYEADVIAAEGVLKPLLERHGQRLVWYRYPYLRTGPTQEIHDRLSGFLAQRGYRIAPVTLDNSEWVFAFAYAKALKRDDRETARRIGEAYVAYMVEITAHYEACSQAILGEEVPQVLLIHANRLNLDWLPALLEAYRGRGYRFVSLEDAARHPAYARPDSFTGRWGMSDILKWGKTNGAKVEREPDAPDWVEALSR